MSIADVELIKEIWPSEADMTELVPALAEVGQGLEGRFDPALEVHFYPDQPGAFGTLRGLEGLARGWGEWLEPWESYRYEVEDYVDAGGGAVVVLARVRARTHRDSVEIEHAPAVVCQVRDGRLVRLDFYLERRDAPGDLG